MSEKNFRDLYYSILNNISLAYNNVFRIIFSVVLSDGSEVTIECSPIVSDITSVVFESGKTLNYLLIEFRSGLKFKLYNTGEFIIRHEVEGYSLGNSELKKVVFDGDVYKPIKP